uniref:Uncharacterized protein n=1 Tax=Spermophilus dauricus TaxID=99837 RepID=A0A8C9PWS5_SPEDA
NKKKEKKLPKTFPATTYSGNSWQWLLEIHEGLKQPSKSSTQGLPVGPNSDTSLDDKRPSTPKVWTLIENLNREIRYSLLPSANEAGTSAAVEVNPQMLQELVSAGCDQVGTDLLWLPVGVVTVRSPLQGC